MRLFDKFRSESRDRKDFEELRALHSQIVRERWKREGVVNRSPLPEFAGELLDFEGIFCDRHLPGNLTIADVVELTQVLKHTQQMQGNEEALVASSTKSSPHLPSYQRKGVTVKITGCGFPSLIACMTR